MRVAMYVRVSTQRQAQAQTIEQQLDRLREYSQSQGWPWAEESIFRDDGYSGASLRRPGLDRLREQARQAAFDRIVLTEPSRLARNYVHQMLLLEEFEHAGCQVEFVDHPMSQNPHDQLLLQIRGAVAEYERSLIALAHAARALAEVSGRWITALDPSPVWLPSGSDAPA